MGSVTDRLASEYAAGRLTRRQALSALAGAGVSAALGGMPAFAQSQPRLLGPVRMISHVGFSVSDLKRSAEFYQNLFGFPPLVPTTPASAHTYGFYFDGHFISLNPAPKDRAGRLSHFCIAFRDFKPERDGAKLKAAGFEGVRIDTAGADNWVTLPDPDHVSVQIFDEKYLAPCPTCDPTPDAASMPPPAKAMFRARKIQHLGITVSDLRRSKIFYQKLLGLSGGLRTLAPPRIPAYGLDFNGQFLSLSVVTPQDEAKPGASPIFNKPGNITHYCIGVDKFDAKRDGARLKAAGFQNVQVDTDLIDCIYVRDPDGVIVQISDANYTYQCPTCGPPPV